MTGADKGPEEGEARPKGAGARLMVDNRSFRWFWIAQVVTQTGQSFFWLAILLAISTMTGTDIKAMAWTSAALAMPTLLASVLGGPIVDRYNRRRIMIVTEWVSCFAVALAALFYSMQNLWVLVALLCLCSISAGFFIPAKSALIPQVVERDQLFSANALSGMSMMISLSVGPALAGVVIARLGIEAAFAVDAASFAISALLLLFFVRPVSTPGRDETGARRSYGQELRQGIVFFAGHRELRNTLLLLMLPLFIIAGVMMAIYVPLLQLEFKLDPSRIGLVHSAFGVGLLLGGGIAASGLLRRLSYRALIVSVVLVWALGHIGKGLAPHYLVFLSINVLHGASFIPISSAFSTLIQEETPEKLLGRASGVSQTLIQTANLIGMGVAPPIAQLAGLRGTQVIFGAVPFLTAVLYMVLHAGSGGRSAGPGEADAKDDTDPAETPS